MKLSSLKTCLTGAGFFVAAPALATVFIVGAFVFAAPPENKTSSFINDAPVKIEKVWEGAGWTESRVKIEGCYDTLGWVGLGGNRLLLTSADGGSASILNLRRKTLRKMDLPQKSAGKISLTPDERYIIWWQAPAGSGKTKDLNIFDVAEQKNNPLFPSAVYSHMRSAPNLLSPSGKRIIAPAGWNGPVNLPCGKQIETVPLPDFGDYPEVNPETDFESVMWTRGERVVYFYAHHACALIRYDTDSGVLTRFPAAINTNSAGHIFIAYPYNDWVYIIDRIHEDTDLSGLYLAGVTDGKLIKHKMVDDVYGAAMNYAGEMIFKKYYKRPTQAELDDPIAPLSPDDVSFREAEDYSEGDHLSFYLMNADGAMRLIKKYSPPIRAVGICVSLIGGNFAFLDKSRGDADKSVTFVGIFAKESRGE